MSTNKTKELKLINQKYFCPIEVAINCITGKWKPALLYHLTARPMRFTELIKVIPSASKKVLVEQLRELESDYLVKRKVLDDVVPKGMEYRLTKASRELMPIYLSLHLWGIKQAERKKIPLKIIISDVGKCLQGEEYDYD